MKIIFLANTEVDHHKLGKILFTKNGFKKPISFSGDERKLKLFPYLPDIIKNGELLEDNSDKYGRTNVFNFYTLKSKINIDGKDEVVRVSVRKDNNGRLYYDHVIQKDIGFRKTPSGYKSGGLKPLIIACHKKITLSISFLKMKNNRFRCELFTAR